MQQAASLLHAHRVDPSTVVADYETFARIVDDMRDHGGDLVPASLWTTLDSDAPFEASGRSQFERAFSKASFEARFSSMQRMLQAWVGAGQRPIDDVQERNYALLLRDFDPLRLWKTNIEDAAVRSTLTNADLATIMDTTLLHSYLPKGRGRIRILEVGGGYGRLAEATLNLLGGRACHVLVDAVPGSLYFADAYLRRACPEARIGSFYAGDPYDLDRFDAYVVPAWHFEKLNADNRFDVCVNIESFQEMAQHHVDHYLNLFDRLTVDEGTIYLSNAHRYVFRGRFAYPAHWQKLLCANTPRSWTLDHPTEIFRKTKSDQEAANDALTALYRYTRDRGVDPEGILFHVRLKTLAGPMSARAWRTMIQTVADATRGARSRIGLTRTR